MSIKEILKNNSFLMKESLRILKDSLSKIGNGKVNLALLSDIIVQSYGSKFKISQISRITAIDSRTAVIEPWDNTLIAAIEKSILSSNVGLGSIKSGESLRISFPAMTEEKRLQMIKVIRLKGESNRVALRMIRRDSNNSLKKLSSNNCISLDELKVYQKKIQVETNFMIAASDSTIEDAEKQILIF